MKIRITLLSLCALLAAAGAFAQTKTSGTVTCKPNPSTPVAVADKPNHALAVGGAQCTWTGFEVGGLKSKTGVSTDLDEITGDTVSVRGYHVTTMDNGDTATVRYEGMGKLKDGKPMGGSGHWSYTSGTGKLKGIKGKGTYKGTANADGSMAYEVNGEYQLPK